MKTKFNLGILLTVVLFVSCNKNTDEPIVYNYPAELMQNPIISYDSVGLWHNQFLDYAYSHLIIDGVPSSQVEADNYFIDLSLNFIENVKNIEPGNLDSLFVLTGFSNFPDTFFQAGSNLNLSSEALSLLTALESTLAHFDFVLGADLTALYNSIDSIMNQASYLESIPEKIGVTSCAVTLKYTAQYWTDSANYNKWSSLIVNETKNGNVPNIQMSKKNKGLLIADAVGALEGAVSGGIAGAWLGPWGIAAGAMLGATCQGGAATGVSACISKLFGI